MSGPRIVVIAADSALRQFCRDGLPWAGCTIEFADDLADAIACDLNPDVIVIDLPAAGTQAATRQRLHEYAAAVNCTVIALTDAVGPHEPPPMPGMHILLRPCPPETLWDALAAAIAERGE